MVKAIIRDPFISCRTRWKTNERAIASRLKEESFVRCVSVRHMRSLLTTIGLVLRTRLQTLGIRTLTMAIRTTTIRTTQTMFVLVGDKIKLCIAI